MPALVQLDAPGDVELVTGERHDADWDSRGERLLGDSLAAVADDTTRTREDRAVRQELLDVGVGRYLELGRVLGRSGRHDRKALACEGLERGCDQLRVELERGRCGHEHDRAALRFQPGGRLGRRLPQARSDEPHVRRPVASVVLVWLGGEGDEQVGLQELIVEPADGR